MTTTELRRTHQGHAATHVSFLGVLRSEWIKLTSLRSTVWSYAILFVLTLALAALLAAVIDPAFLPGTDAVDSAVTSATFGAFFGQLIVAVLGVLFITGEYTTGQIRSSLSAVPTRLPVLGAKALVLFVTTFVVSAISILLGYIIAAVILSSRELGSDFAVTEAIRPLVGNAIYLAIIAVFALGIGTIIRNTGGGMAAALGVILLLPVIMAIIPITWINEAQVYLLTSAGTALAGGPSTLELWQQILVTVIWVFGSLGLGALLLARRDA